MGRNKKICSMTIEKGKKFPPVVHGLKGIMQIFAVSKPTASRYKNTILKEAVAQQGNVIIVDVEACLKIWGLQNPEALIDKNIEYEEFV